MISLLIWLLILLIVFGAVWYVLDLMPIDARFKQIAKIVVGLILLLILLSMLLGWPYTYGPRLAPPL